MNNRNTIGRYFTFLIPVISFSLSLVSIVNSDVYSPRINSITEFELLGQDAVTLIISTVFLLTFLHNDVGRIRVKIIQMGFLTYLFYIYAYYSFGGVSGSFYLLYVLIAAMSLSAFSVKLIKVMQYRLFPSPSEKYPWKTVSLFLAICVFAVASTEVKELFEMTVLKHDSLNPFFVFYVLDLSIILPLMITASFLNLMKSGAGYFLSGISLIKIITILPAVVLDDVFHWIFAGSFRGPAFDVFAAVITFAGFMIFLVYLKTINEKPDGITPEIIH